MELTPLLQQWKSIKKKYNDAILFFRLGDFYETFYDDAILSSKILGIALTQRQQGVPLAGVPYHSASPYIAKLVNAGYKVAICEQLEEPKPGKLVKRDVVEVLTSGTFIDDTQIDVNKNNYLCSICSDGKKYGLAVIDLMTGEFKITQLEYNSIIDEIRKLAPKEIIIPQGANFNFSLDGVTITKRPDYEFMYETANEKLCSHFNVASLSGFGCDGLEVGICSAGAIISYLQEMKKPITHITKILPYFPNEYLIIDEITRKNIEVTKKINGEEGEGTLLHVIDHCQTSMGKRLLRSWLNQPLRDKEKINHRLNDVTYFVNNHKKIHEMQKILSKMSDIERIANKVAMLKANPRDLVLLSNGIKLLKNINEIIGDRFNFPQMDDLIKFIDNSIVDDPPITLQEGNIIRKGFNKELDEIREIAIDGKKWISNYELKERMRTGIQSLKIGYNNVFGYYIEVTKPNLKFVPKNYIRKQTLSNAERFITDELKSYEDKILSAEERSKNLEYEIFCEIRKEVAKYNEILQEIAKKIAYIDVIISLAYVAINNNYVRPEITDEDVIIIKDGRHPVVEKLLSEGEFVPNFTKLDNDERIYIITGPNMSGKSTYLRQVALIVLLAHIGSYVPASYAKIGICDRIFTRIGASDDVSRGVSTFLAEMSETANILNNATKNSLVLLDEIGRGTSTFDGMAIAWATIEYLLKKIGCKTLFATHYHELTEMSSLSNKIKNYHMGAKREGDRVIFMRKLLPGGCDESYGIDVAKLAGVPKEVIERASEILKYIEIKEERRKRKRVKDRQEKIFKEKEEKLLEEIEKIDINKLTPIDAIILLKNIKEKIENNKK